MLYHLSYRKACWITTSAHSLLFVHEALCGVVSPCFIRAVLVQTVVKIWLFSVIVSWTGCWSKDLWWAVQFCQPKHQHFTCAPAETGLTSSGGYRCIRAAPPPHWGTMSGDSWEIVAMGIANVLSKYCIFVTYVPCPEVTMFYLRYLGALDEIMVSAHNLGKTSQKSPSLLYCVIWNQLLHSWYFEWGEHTAQT